MFVKLVLLSPFSLSDISSRATLFCRAKCNCSNRSRTLTSVTDSPKEPGSPPNHEGPSWGLMLALIFLAMLVAIAIAWAFIHPLLHPH
jgi:hypothetical protein